MSVNWTLNRGAAKLRDQIKAQKAGRVIGTIGDARHASENPSSDHNPKKVGRKILVNALDPMVTRALTKSELDVIIYAIVKSRDPRVKIIIWQGRIISGNGGIAPWVWRKYTGTSDPHTGHAHISVKDSADNDVSPWAITTGATKSPTKAPAKTPAKTPAKAPARPELKKGSKGPAVATLQKALNRHGYKLTVDEGFGSKTYAAVVMFQRAHLKAVGRADGVVGKRTWAALLD